MGTGIEKQLATGLKDKDREFIWHPFTPLVGSTENLVISQAEGARLITEDGQVIIDAIASWWVNLHGHSHPAIAQAIAQQAQQLEHVMFAGCTHEPAITLAENLLSILPGNQSKIFYSDNGSTAVEVGLKMALQYWHNQNISKSRVIALEGAYHGDTFGAMSLGERGAFTTPFWPYLFDVEFIPLPTGDAVDESIQHFKDILKSGQVAAFIFEPLIQGASGMREYAPEVLDTLIELAREHHVLCIADEVMTGFGRTGKMFASDYLNHKPDIICLSKGLTGGAMALGATSCTAAIQQAYLHQDILKTFFHGHSFTANPLACAAANASFSLLVSEECQQHIKRISALHKEFKQRLSGHQGLQRITHLGTILAIEIKSDEKSSYVNEARHRLYPFFLSRGVLLRPLGNIVYILPPYVITDDELSQVYRTLEELLEVINEPT
ncbi:MAG: adenosylmethionine--8-amino-7-oxononanoate transaminase [Cyclobacteriaceae bacterium]|nr:adenosylmethionine--8-amino-7-oxononanoate transaminase [Cyclobacteriaceae bacterium]